MTAAHCLCNMQTGDCSILKPSDIDVIVGEHDQTDTADGTRHHICSYDKLNGTNLIGKLSEIFYNIYALCLL